MEDDGFVPPLMPDDFEALAQLAGPLYQQSKLIEAYTSSNPIPNAMTDYGSNNIRMGLEQAKHLAQASVARPQPSYVAPAPQSFIQASPVAQDVVVGVAQFTPYPQPMPSPPKEDNGQMEFQFNSSEQKITNDLLREISKKLSRLITLIERSSGEDTPPKLKPNVKQNQVL